MINLFTFPMRKSILHPFVRSIMTTNAVKAKKLLETLKDNPYFDKYAASIARLQQVNPDEFVSRVENHEKKKLGRVNNEQKETVANFDEKSPGAKPKPSIDVRAPNAPKLSDVMKLELIKDKGKQEIIDIWLDYHKKKDCICGIMEPKIHDTMFERGAKYPTFVLPLPRKNGYEFILSQFSGQEIHMTPLVYYQAHHENAPECLKIVHYTDLRESKDIILMKGEFDTNTLSVQEAQCLANELQLYYAQNNPDRLKLLEIFTNTPDQFKHMDLISQLESINLMSNTLPKNYSQSHHLWTPRKVGWHRAIQRSCINRINSGSYRNYATKSVYITTPIFYVNAGPHIGHLYTATLADALARYNKMLGHEVFLNTGTDEHGNKVRNAALAQKLSPEQYSEQISAMFKHMCDSFEIGYDNFIRTTETRHHEVVRQFWTKLQNSGHIYLGKYSGWYCVSDEAFVGESELEKIVDGAGNVSTVCTASGNVVEWMEEDNYKFRLSHFQNDLKYWLKDSQVVRPEKYHKILSAWVDEGTCLEDLSVSRPISRAPWGIKVPNDSSQTIYVWLDALTNYLTSVGYPNEEFAKMWPPSIQVLGKDILKFHGIYWPAFLMAAGLEPPARLLCHSHWTVYDEKMSKSKGNVVSPHDAAKIFTTDGLRYFLLREAVPHNDGNYSNEKICDILNTQLANTLGNLVTRCMGKAINPHGVIPEPTVEDVDTLNSDEARKLHESLESVPTIAENGYYEGNLHQVVDGAMQTLYAANKMVEYHKPWVLAKQVPTDEAARPKLNAVIAMGLEAVRTTSIIMLPIAPRLMSNLLDSLNVPNTARMWSNCKYLNTGRESMNVSTLQREKALFFKKIKLNE